MERLTKFQSFQLWLQVGVLYLVLNLLGWITASSRRMVLAVSRTLLEERSHHSVRRARTEPYYVAFLWRTLTDVDNRHVLSRLVDDEAYWKALSSDAMHNGDNSLESAASAVILDNEFSSVVRERIVDSFIGRWNSPETALLASEQKTIRPYLWERVQPRRHQVDVNGELKSPADVRIDVALDMLTQESGRHVEKAVELLLTDRYRDAVTARAMEVSKAVTIARTFAPRDQREALEKVGRLVQLYLPLKTTTRLSLN